MILEGVKIIVLGMLTVFVMLGVLVTGTWISSRIIHALEGSPAGPDRAPGQPSAAGKPKPIAAVITAAVMKFRGR